MTVTRPGIILELDLAINNYAHKLPYVYCGVFLAKLSFESQVIACLP